VRRYHHGYLVADRIQQQLANQTQQLADLYQTDGVNSKFGKFKHEVNQFFYFIQNKESHLKVALTLLTTPPAQQHGKTPASTLLSPPTPPYKPTLWTPANVSLLNVDRYLQDGK
jgi:hypothetical protein